ncbi:uncharacterized protein LOC125551918 isoform X1 [Triticum urartu]|uniref:uncharacterized protein LOC125551918 isoform X1 n=1 Tax=Triticum urartu TaxID=4572 RepID=UPI0020436E5B|nr:uncharacterized protein LOC125551918 isoform X1 [Triticum urartu]
MTSPSLPPPPPPLLLPTHTDTGNTRAAREEKEEEREMAGCGEAKTSSVSMDEEACGLEKKKFGGMAPKKPLISKVTALASKYRHCQAWKIYGSLEEDVSLIWSGCMLMLTMQDHERAYFDSADWVLGKQAANSSSTAAVESLKPKLKRTPHPQLPPRKPTCASG